MKKIQNIIQRLVGAKSKSKNFMGLNLGDVFSLIGIPQIPKVKTNSIFDTFTPKQLKRMGLIPNFEGLKTNVIELEKAVNDIHDIRCASLFNWENEVMRQQEEAIIHALGMLYGILWNLGILMPPIDLKENPFKNMQKFDL